MVNIFLLRLSDNKEKGVMMGEGKDNKIVIAKRLKGFRKGIGMNQTQFGKTLEIGQAAYSSIETGVTELTEKNIYLICLKHGISKTWLLTGKGEMLDPNKKGTHKEERLVELFRGLSPKAQDMVIEYIEGLLDYEESLGLHKEATQKKSDAG